MLSLMFINLYGRCVFSAMRYLFCIRHSILSFLGLVKSVFLAIDDMKNTYLGAFSKTQSPRPCIVPLAYGFRQNEWLLVFFLFFFFFYLTRHKISFTTCFHLTSGSHAQLICFKFVCHYWRFLCITSMHHQPEQIPSVHFLILYLFLLAISFT